MNLQTKIPLKAQYDNPIDYQSHVLLLGSCFVENIGGKLDYYKFKNTQNPFGILFHPQAIENLLLKAVEEKIYTETDVFYNNEQWQCFEAHSKLNHADKSVLLQRLNSQIKLTSNAVKRASHVIITLGTAWVYQHLETDSVVANCHKFPSKHFKKSLYSVSAILKSLNAISNFIYGVNPSAKIIFTVSPIRHLKDGFIENTQSKAHLITAIHGFLNQKAVSGSAQSHYFPSYEIMMDELRDYRFYKEDMIHPSQTAIQYIWNAFKTVWVAEDATKTMELVDAIQKGMQHKPFNADSEAYQQFLKNIHKKKMALQDEFPEIQF